MEKVESTLFEGLTDDEYARMTECFKTTLRAHRKGEEVAIPQGRVGVVHRGRISVMKTDEDGVRTIFEQLASGGVFGAMLGIAAADAGFFLVAEEDCEVLYVDYDHIMKRCPKACAYHSTIVRNLVRLMADKTQALSEHLEILSHRTTRDKAHGVFPHACGKEPQPLLYPAFFADQPCRLPVRGPQRHAARTCEHAPRRARGDRPPKRKTEPA